MRIIGFLGISDRIKRNLANILPDLNDIGNVPYSLARPFLLKIESPEKLVSHPPGGWSTKQLTTYASPSTEIPGVAVATDSALR